MIALDPRSIGRIVLLGAATGSRSTMGLAALALTARSGPMARPAVQIACVGAAAAELVIDKLPSTPSRLQSRGLIGRAALGGLGGGLLAARLADRGRDSGWRDQAAGVALGSAVALAGAFVGAGWRVRAARRGIGGRFGAAVAEDLVAQGLAAIAVTRA